MNTEHNFVSIGSALPSFNEDEIIPKPVRYDEMVATDDKGRRRFHGAFTGGFSAGFFNSVGSKEGWAPSQFLSSREKRNDEKPERRPEDFMDDEDFSEFGIAPRKLAVTDEFSGYKKRKFVVTENISSNAELSLLNLIIPSKTSIGAKLLQKLGWKEGQGIGPRISKKNRISQNNNGDKIYGCQIEPDSDNEDKFMENITFAPEDIPPIKLQPKDNTKGLGYVGIEPENRYQLFNSKSVTTTKYSKKGITGSAFGVGALEEDDDPFVYDYENLNDYNMQLGSDDDDNNDAENNIAKKTNLRLDKTPIDYIGNMIEGFSLSTIDETTTIRSYHCPDIPHDFRPRNLKINNNPDKSPFLKHHSIKLNARRREVILNDKPQVKSIFDLISNSDKKRLHNIVQNTRNVNSINKNSQLNSISFIPSSKEIIPPDEQRLSGIPMSKVNNFKPFSKDSAKQSRYEEFKKCIDNGMSYFPDQKYRLTEWEIARELEEFQRANHLFAPMSVVMSSRFTSAKFDDNDHSAKIENLEKISDEEKAANMNMFGRLTHKQSEWHPDKLLCKRFNIQNPYPESDIVGLITVKQDKFSLFNVLAIPEDKNKSYLEKTSLPEIKDAVEENKTANIKPLAFAVDVFERDRKRELEKQSESIADESIEKNIKESNYLESEKQVEELIPRPSMDLFASIFGTDENEFEDKSGDKQISSLDIFDSIVETSQMINNTEKNIDKGNSLKSERRKLIENSSFSKFLTVENIKSKTTVKESYNDSIEKEKKNSPDKITEAILSEIGSSSKLFLSDLKSKKKKKKVKKEKKNKKKKKSKH